jgi:hypothetical protein
MPLRQFTVGTLFLSRDLSGVESALQGADLPHAIRALSERWSVFVTEDEWHFLPDTQAAVRQVSRVAPLLHFSHAKDHGWSFRLLQGGQERATFAEHYPWDPHHDGLIGEDDPHTPHPLPDPDDLIYFRLLDLSEEDVLALTLLLRVGHASGDRAEAFMRLLGVPVLDSLSYPVESASQ